MVNGQVITVGVTDQSVIAALLAIPRRAFVPPAMKSISHIDSDLKLSECTATRPARFLMRVGPFAKLVQAAKIRPTDTVLDVGCGTGYSSAVLARLSASVSGLEIYDDLAELARETLAHLGVDNVTIVAGLLKLGWPQGQPYDVIFIGGSVEHIPDALASQMKDGGRMVTIVGRGPAASARLYVKSGSILSGRKIFDAAAPPLPGFAAPEQFLF
jgi:protein-L-isoaspartate(D-aspartate) O-methyltransferase